MNVLYLAYAAEPGSGSEYGVGWMIPLTMAKCYPYVNVYVLTRSRCREKIESALGELALPNLKYFFYDIPSFLYYKNEMGSRWGEQSNYLIWQILVRKKVCILHKKIKYDIVHHITFNQYRTPSPGFWCDIPFVMGPIGGAETIAQCFYRDLDKHSLIKEKIRHNKIDLFLFRWLNSRCNNKKVILCSSRETEKKIFHYCGQSILHVYPAIGYSVNDFPKVSMLKTHDKFEMLYAGKALDWKGLYIFLKAVKIAFIDKDIKNFNIRIVGVRYDAEINRVKKWIRELQLIDNVEIVRFISRDKLLKIESLCDLFVYPAFRDSGSMSILEACALECPSICFDVGGQDAFPNNCLIKVPVGNSYEDTLMEFAKKISWAYYNKEELTSLGKRAREWVERNMTWENKINYFFDLYSDILC